MSSCRERRKILLSVLIQSKKILGDKMKKRRVDIEKLKELFKEGKSDKEIAEAFGVSEYTIKSYRWKLGLLKREQKKQAIEKKLEDAIVMLNKMGFNDREIAAILGISVNTVEKYRARRNLKPVGLTCCSIYKHLLSKYKNKLAEARKFGRLVEKYGIFEAMEKMNLSKRDAARMLAVYQKLQFLDQCSKESFEAIEMVLKDLFSSPRD